MSKRRTRISVIGEIGVIENLRDQVVNLSKKKGISIADVAEKMGVTRQYVYAELCRGTIREHKLIEILKSLGASLKDLRVSKPGA